jgi:hypothetical protein
VGEVWAGLVAGRECAPSSIERVRLIDVQCWTVASLLRGWRELVVERSLAQSFVRPDGHNFSFHKQNRKASFAGLSRCPCVVEPLRPSQALKPRTLLYVWRVFVHTFDMFWVMVLCDSWGDAYDTCSIWCEAKELIQYPARRVCRPHNVKIYPIYS